jgi:myo-inositol-1(or 4)-monophosphatase
LPAADDLALLLATVRDAGAVALQMRPGVKSWNKPDNTVLTEADLAVDALLKSRITAARPDDGWLSEETPDTPARLSKSRLWIADPIDGTRAFAHGGGHWGVGVALVEHGQPILSALYRPADDLLFHAIKGGGAFLNGDPLTRQPLRSDATAVAPRRFEAALEPRFGAIHNSSPYPLLLRFAAIATGHMHIALSQGQKNDWDLAAGHLILTEAGGAVANLNGEEMIYNRENPWQPGLIAAPDAATLQMILETLRAT